MNLSCCPCLCFALTEAVVLSPAGKILTLTAPLAEQLTYREDELKGKSFQRLVAPTSQSKARALFQSGSERAQLSLSLVRADGKEIPARLFACRHGKGWTVRVQFDQDEQERLKRDLLLREVHHRIKNNLQGIAGLLYNQALAHPELAPVLETPIRQLNAIALLYGLHSQGESEVFLCQLCQIIAQAGQGLSQVPLTVDIPYLKTIKVRDEEAITIALILNELLANAIKHGQGPIHLMLRRQGEEAQVILRNPSCAQMALDWEQGQGLGTGLQLVRALLPKQAELQIEQEKAEVIATLSLRPPLIRFV